MLHVLDINDPAVDEPMVRQILQLLSGFDGMALLTLLFAVVLESLGAFRTASALRLPPRGCVAETLASGAEANLLKLAELRDTSLLTQPGRTARAVPARSRMGKKPQGGAEERAGACGPARWTCVLLQAQWSSPRASSAPTRLTARDAGPHQKEEGAGPSTRN